MFWVLFMYETYQHLPFILIANNFTRYAKIIAIDVKRNKSNYWFLLLFYILKFCGCLHKQFHLHFIWLSQMWGPSEFWKTFLTWKFCVNKMFDFTLSASTQTSNLLEKEKGGPTFRQIQIKPLREKEREMIFVVLF